MSDEEKKAPGPLWKYMPLETAHVPPVKRTSMPADPRVLPREPSPDEIEPLRIEGEWRPLIILRRFGPAKADNEYLPRLLVACGVLQGAHRLREIADRLLSMIAIAVPRVQRLAEDKAVERRKPQLEDVLARLQVARQDLPATRARAANEADHAHPDGLRGIDLEMLVIHAGAVIVGSEIATKRNATGIDFAIHLGSTSPEQRYAEDWVDRALGAPLSGILLFTPPEYGRVVVVYGDGRLAYDPAQSDDDDD
jgi:hypothetical protein